MTFDLNSISEYDRAAMMICCAGFVAQGNLIFASLYGALAEGGQVEIEIPIRAHDEDLVQAIMFFQKTLEEWKAKPEKAEQSAPAIDFCKIVLDCLFEAHGLRQKRRAAVSN